MVSSTLGRFRCSSYALLLHPSFRFCLLYQHVHAQSLRTPKRPIVHTCEAIVNVVEQMERESVPLVSEWVHTMLVQVSTALLKSMASPTVSMVMVLTVTHPKHLHHHHHKHRRLLMVPMALRLAST